MTGRVRAALLAVLLASCSAATWYTIRIDLLSFLPAETLQGSTTVGPSTPVAAYLLPVIEFVQGAALPPVEVRTGMLLEAPGGLPERGEALVEAAVAATLRNSSATQSLPGAVAELYLADAGAANIYAEGFAYQTLSLPAVGPGETQDVRIEFAVSSTDAGYAIVRSGRFRLGIKLTIPATGGLSVDLGYSVETLQVRFSLRPFSLI